ncbi:MAG: hypothetical protein BWZ07_03330 [Alphaproteobacteria bacterium ADurb.BinA280]|nr:MAG: hypothetical protein BWZ07_03330 [Alphaproteobacteria bacterium ADurb.BinA280]
MAIKANLGLCRITDAELACDVPGCLAAQGLPGLGVGIELLPDGKFVLQHVGIAEWL